MPQAIRIEHPSDGIGIFVTRYKDERGEYTSGYMVAKFDYEPFDVGDMCNRHYKFNTPREDHISFEVGKHFCAYKTIEQVNEWITHDEMLQLIDYGFAVYVLELSDILEGEHQIMFDKDNIIERKDITELFK